ncbi:ElyC/SanA/YdcF family protein [Thioalkalicoccus limnaeus]|uniref:ElyC/SanA/YdcF family protein n=1 Tax=Thioalkalicoccus limnaeus TaxID=120681 RepID=A0ABV4BCV0_9GAMM
MASDAKAPDRRRIGVIAVATAILLSPILILFGIDLAITLLARGQIHDDLARVPPAPVALVLGTSSRRPGGPNLFYSPRIEAAAELYHAGRVRAILVSGDNATPHYNEPQTMRRDLIAHGVPDEYITLDYAGFRTLDSMIRAKAVFGQDHLIIVSQRFHAERALFLAHHAGIRATAYAAADPSQNWYSRVRRRETLARAAAVLDLLRARGPRFLGDPERVPLRPLLESPPSDDPCPSGSSC